MENSEIIIRLARRTDFEEMHEIYRHYISHTAVSFETRDPGYMEFSGRIRRVMEKYPCVVAEEDGCIIGYAYANSFKGRAAYDWSVETSIYLERNQRRRGIGRKLYAALEEILVAQGIRNMCACIAVPREENDPYLTRDSADFHSRLGYRLVGEFDGCANKFGRWYNMVWMEKHIAEHNPQPQAIKPFPSVRSRLARYDVPFPKDTALAKALCEDAQGNFQAACSGSSDYYEEVYFDCIRSAIEPWRKAALMGYDAGLEGLEQDHEKIAFNIDFLLQCLENGSDYAMEFMGRHIFRTKYGPLFSDFCSLLEDEDPAAMCAQGLWLLYGNDQHPGHYHPEKISKSPERAEEGYHLLERAAKGGSMRAKCESAIAAYDPSRQEGSTWSPARRRQAERDILECLRAGYPYAFRALASTKLYERKDSIYDWEPLNEVLWDPSICACLEYSFLENLYQHLYSGGEPEFDQEAVDAVLEAVKQIIEINRDK